MRNFIHKIYRALWAKKKLFSLFFSVIASMSVWGAINAQIGDYNYMLNTENKTAGITGVIRGLASTITMIEIPDTVTYNGENYGVICIKRSAFFNCPELVSVIIPEGITTIEVDAFWMCRKLASINIPNSVTSIESGAFAQCDSLKTVFIPASVLNLEGGPSTASSAFHGCRGMLSIDVDVNNPNYCSVDGVLFDKDKTRLIQYPCVKQGEYIIPGTVTNVKSSAFSYCLGLTSLTIPASVTSFGSGLWGCDNLTTIILNSNHVIDTSVSLRGAQYVNNIFLGENVIDINEDAFTDCPNLISISVDANNPNYCSADGVLFNKDTTLLIKCMEQYQGEYTIPNSVTTIKKKAFYKCSHLTSVTIPEGVTHIEDSTFAKCKELTTVSIPSSVTSLGKDAFSRCESLTPFIVPATITSIGEDAFGNIPLVIYHGRATGAPWGAKSINNYSPNPYDSRPSAIDVNDNSLADWDNLPANYVVETTCPADAGWLGLKNAKIYADAYYINILIEPNMAELPDLSDVPFHVFIDTDNNDKTGGYGDMFLDPNTDIMTEGALFIDDAPNSYNPFVFEWWGEVGGSGWNWTDPENPGDETNFWGALVCENSTPAIGNSQLVDGKFEIQLCRELIPANWNDTMIGLGLDIQQNWSAVGILPISSPTDMNPHGYANKLKVKIDNSNRIPMPFIDGVLYRLNEEEHSAQVQPHYYMDSIVIPTSVVYEGQTYAVTSIKDQAFMPALELSSLTCLATTPLPLGQNVFDGVDKVIPLYVPAGSEAAYRAAEQWRDFLDIRPIGQAETAEVVEPQAEPTTNSVVIEWPLVAEADTYIIEIRKDSILVCTLIFDASGHLISTASTAPSRNGKSNARKASQTAMGWQYVVGGLDSGTEYTCTVIAKQNDDIVIYQTSIPFSTTSEGIATGIDNLDSSSLQGGDRGRLIYRNGQIFILRGEKIYTLQGQEVK